MRFPPPARELRARRHDPVDTWSTSYKVYAAGRLKGAIIPIEEDEDGARWESIALDGSVARWKYRNHARDYLCELPLPARPHGGR
ncbi:MAG TPA: hypothetical protein PKK39_04230 [Tepidiformaceae bacterium]|nr:hypothetical protein [Tepidiformaceae bacterium]